MRPRCAGLRADGYPCRAYPVAHSDLCSRHQAEAEAKRTNESTTAPRWMQPAPPRSDREWWEAIPSPLPPAEVALLRRAIGYQPTEPNRTNEREDAA